MFLALVAVPVIPSAVEGSFVSRPRRHSCHPERSRGIFCFMPSSTFLSSRAQPRDLLFAPSSPFLSSRAQPRDLLFRALVAVPVILSEGEAEVERSESLTIAATPVPCHCGPVRTPVRHYALTPRILSLRASARWHGNPFSSISSPLPVQTDKGTPIRCAPPSLYKNKM